MQREDEIRKFLSDLREKNDYAYVLLLVTDIFEEGSMFIVEGLHGHVDRVFGIDSSKSVGARHPFAQEAGRCSAARALSPKRTILAKEKASSSAGLFLFD